MSKPEPMTPKRSAIIALGAISDSLNNNRFPSEVEAITRSQLHAHNGRLLQWSAHLAAHARALQHEPESPANTEMQSALEYVLPILEVIARLGRCAQGGEQTGNHVHVMEAEKIVRAALKKGTSHAR